MAGRGLTMNTTFVMDPTSRWKSLLVSTTWSTMWATLRWRWRPILGGGGKACEWSSHPSLNKIHGTQVKDMESYQMCEPFSPKTLKP